MGKEKGKGGPPKGQGRGPPKGGPGIHYMVVRKKQDGGPQFNRKQGQKPQNLSRIVGYLNGKPVRSTADGKAPAVVMDKHPPNNNRFIGKKNPMLK